MFLPTSNSLLSDLSLGACHLKLVTNWNKWLKIYIRLKIQKFFKKLDKHQAILIQNNCFYEIICKTKHRITLFMDSEFVLKRQCFRNYTFYLL